MPIAEADLRAALSAAFPDASIRLIDMAGDNDHWQATIISESFRGLTRVKQHQMVYDALKGRVGGEIHALALLTSPPQQSG